MSSAFGRLIVKLHVFDGLITRRHRVSSAGCEFGVEKMKPLAESAAKKVSRITIVSPDQDACEPLARNLRSNSREISIFSSPFSALAAAKKDPPDLAVIDCSEASETWIIPAMRNLSAGARFILISGSLEKAPESPDNVRVDVFLKKPVGPDALSQAANSLLFKHARILAIDDSAIMLKIQASRFLANGYANVRTLDNSDAVLDEIRKEPIDLLITDFEMSPHCNGIELIAKIKGEMPDMPFKAIMYSGEDFRIADFAAAGIVFLSKGVESKIIMGEVEKALLELFSS